MSTWDVVAGAQHVALCWREVPADCQVDASRQCGHLKSEPAQRASKVLTVFCRCCVFAQRHPEPADRRALPTALLALHAAGTLPYKITVNAMCSSIVKSWPSLFPQA